MLIHPHTKIAAQLLIHRRRPTPTLIACYLLSYTIPQPLLPYPSPPHTRPLLMCLLLPLLLSPGDHGGWPRLGRREGSGIGLERGRQRSVYPSPATVGRLDPSPATTGRPDPSPVTAGTMAAGLGQGGNDDGGDGDNSGDGDDDDGWGDDDDGWIRVLGGF